MEDPLNITTPQTSRRYLAAAGITITTLALSGCGGAQGSLGYNAFMHADDPEMLAICEGFFGDAESIGKRLGLTLYDAQRSGECRYETNTGGELWLRVADEKPADPDGR